jgi:uncharacterized protein (DUF302 family)
MLRNILSVIGAIAVIGLIVMGVKFGGMASKVSTLDPAAMGEYMGMFGRVLETGNSADAMVRKVKINDDISTEDAIEAMNALAEENNFLVVGDAKMNIESSIKKTGKKDDRYIRILSYCSPSIAKQFIDYSKAFGAFMPCRILIVEDDEGNRWLYTMAMELLISGGKTLPDDMLKMASHVRSLMYGMMDAGATGDEPEISEY